jgi:hypothetical protein
MPGKTIKPKSLLLISCMTCLVATSQTHFETVANPLGYQWGFSLKATIEFSLKKNTQKTVFRLCGDLGMASEFLANAIYPSINVEAQIYNGGLGSMRRSSYNKPAVDMDFIIAFTVTTGFNNRFATGKVSPEIADERMKPLYYFADFVNPALQNPYDYSLSLGTNVILSTDENKTVQRIGFLNAHLSSVQFSYYNDGGTPFDQLHTGDGKDRYYTGGAVISYTGKQQDPINHIELSFHKFTGYTKNAFEVSNKLNLAYVDYYKTDQKFFNKSMWSFTVSNPIKGYGATIKRYNYTKWDVQHLIHWSSFNSYHLVPYDDYFALAGSYFFGYASIGIR